MVMAFATMTMPVNTSKGIQARRSRALLCSGLEPSSSSSAMLPTDNEDGEAMYPSAFLSPSSGLRLLVGSGSSSDSSSSSSGSRPRIWQTDSLLWLLSDFSVLTLLLDLVLVAFRAGAGLRRRAAASASPTSLMRAFSSPCSASFSTLSAPM